MSQIELTIVIFIFCYVNYLLRLVTERKKAPDAKSDAFWEAVDVMSVCFGTLPPEFSNSAR